MLLQQPLNCRDTISVVDRGIEFDNVTSHLFGGPGQTPQGTPGLVKFDDNLVDSLGILELMFELGN